MSITPLYNLEVGPLDRSTDDGYVNVIHWRMVGIHTVGVGTEAVTYKSDRYGSYSFPAGDPTTVVGFIPYDNLTLSDVQDWWTVGMGSTSIDRIKVGIRTDILNQITPSTLLGVPW